MHEQYAAIEWIDPAAPKDETERQILASGWREAFVRPAADAEVWRERPYELYAGVVWESGQFDRVVFTGAGENRSAIVYDFKTNAKGGDESDEAFVRRIKEYYADQMADYRAAIGRLTGLPSNRIQTKLLLQATGAVVEVS